MSEHERETTDPRAETVTPAEPDAEPEAEPDAEPEAERDAPEPSPTPDAPETQAMLEERGKRFEKLSQHVAKRTGEILGDDVQIVQECPCCTYWGMPGWIPTVNPPQDLAAVLLHYLGQHAPTDYRPDTHSKACEACGGMGEVASGSRVFGQERLPCVECASNGWVATDDERRSRLLSLRNGEHPPTFPAAPADAAMSPNAEPEPPEAAELRARGYIVMPPIIVNG